jgi:hypothetical protein
MKKSESIKNICKALITFKVKVGAITKDSKNPFFKSSYASLGSIIEAIEEPLAESGLAVMQFPTGDHCLTTIVMHESGEWLQSVYRIRPVKDDAQGIGSCLTYQKRYALVSALLLNILEPDDDGNYATYGNGNPNNHNNSNNSDKEKPWLNKNTDAFAKVQAYLMDNGNLDNVKLKYRLNKEMETFLSTLIKSK